MIDLTKSWIGDWTKRPEFDTTEKRWCEMMSIFWVVSRRINPWVFDEATNERRKLAMIEEFRRRTYKVT